jgi:DNA polymerase III epsilon subunit-like protein
MRKQGRATLVIIDTETNGFPGMPWSRVVQLGAVALDEAMEEVAAFTIQVLPGLLETRHPAARKAFQVTGIDPAALQRSGVPERTAARLFCLWHIAIGEPDCTAWKTRFDRPMIERMGLLDLPWTWCMEKRFKFGRGLNDTCAEYGIVRHGDHDALEDCRTAAEVYRRAQHTGPRCSGCGAPQYQTPGGVVCMQGHGGTPAKLGTEGRAPRHPEWNRLAAEADTRAASGGTW